MASERVIGLWYDCCTTTLSCIHPGVRNPPPVMELYQLRSFAAVAELGHLTRAADDCMSASRRCRPNSLARGDARRHPLRAWKLRDVPYRGRTPDPASAREIVAKAAALRGLALSFEGDVAGRVSVGTLADPAILRLGKCSRRLASSIRSSRSSSTMKCRAPRSPRSERRAGRELLYGPLTTRASPRCRCVRSFTALRRRPRGGIASRTPTTRRSLHSPGS